MEEKTSENDQKSLLYFMGAWSVGGVERVTAVIGNELARRGWKVTIFAFHLENPMLLSQLDERIEFVAPEAGVMTPESMDALRRKLIERKVKYIINDWSLPFKTTLFLRKAARGLDVKLLVNLHNAPDNNARIASARNPLLRFAVKLVSALNMHLTYLLSDGYVLLSRNFIPVFKRFAFMPFPKHLYAIANPLAIAADGSVDVDNKAQSVLYVGRLEERQKRFSRVASLWKRMAPKFPSWQLEVVGDGPDRKQYEEALEGTNGVVFHGFKSPESFYRRAKILALTSEFEGFGLVIVEAMAYGCVPVVLNSFAAASDVVDCEGGELVPAPYKEETFASALGRLMSDPDYWRKKSDAGICAAKRFSVANVADQWENLLAMFK